MSDHAQSHQNARVGLGRCLPQWLAAPLHAGALEGPADAELAVVASGLRAGVKEAFGGDLLTRYEVRDGVLGGVVPLTDVDVAGFLAEAVVGDGDAQRGDALVIGVVRDPSR